MSEDFITHLNASRFMARRAIDAATIEVTPPDHYALPGALAPIHRDRLEAHQEDGLTEHQIVVYENERFMDATAGRREQHARWVSRDYDARVQAHRELEAERRQKEARASAEYQAKLAAILAAKDAEGGDVA